MNTSYLWKKFFTLPQSQMLLGGMGGGYLVLVLLMPGQPIAWGVGLGIVGLTVGAWAVQLKPYWESQTNNFFDVTVFRSKLPKGFKAGARRSQWEEVLHCALDIQKNANLIHEQSPDLDLFLLNILYSVVQLTEVLEQLLQHWDDSDTPAYRHKRESQWDKYFQILQDNKTKIGVLFESLLLKNLEQQIPVNLSQELEILISANQSILDSSNQEELL